MTARLIRLLPPPLILLVLAGVMAWQARPLALADAAWPRVAAAGLAGLALAIGAAGLWQFRRARTTFDPTRPERAAALVRDGLYRHTRNPMYVAELGLLLAWALWLRDPWMLPGPLLFFLWLDRVQIPCEERALAARFGVHFAAYRAAVRRWL